MTFKNDLTTRRAEFARVVGTRTTATFRGYGARVECIESGEFTTRAMFNWWQRDGWIREESHEKNRAVYEVVEVATWLEMSA